MAFDPKCDKFPYPIDTDKHYLIVKKNDGTVFDKNYPYIDNSKSFRFKRKVMKILLIIIAKPVVAIRLGLRVKGKKNLKKHKDVIKKGIVSTSNHVHMWDYLALSTTLLHHKLHVLSWAPDISGENGKMIRLTGGIPIPENDLRATVTYLKSVNKMIKDGGWLQIYAEGSMWEYYQPIRPFKKGMAYFSIKNDVPILPMAFSYRKPGWIRRKIFRQIALFTLNIGEPIYPNKELEGNDAEIDLTTRVHDEVCRLAGIDPKENIYEPIFNDSKRIDYYTDTYGLNYKGSH